MILEHFSAEPYLQPYSEGQKPLPRHKPDGLWVSVKGECDWKWWCEQNEFGFDRMQYRFGIELHDDARILIVKGPAALREFTDEYCEPVNDETSNIYWSRVAEQHDGIIITPYLWSCRLEAEFGWYYGWDCASGCIWNHEAIAEVRDACPV